MGRETMTMRWARKALAVLMACALVLGLAPVPALADEPPAATDAGTSELRLEAGTYIEHEALALVSNDAAAPLARSNASDALSGAEDLMGVSAEAVNEALDDDAGLTVRARNGVAAPAAGSASESEDSGASEVPANGSSDESGDVSGAASDGLASTGDTSTLVPVVLVCGGAACALLVSLKALREKKTRL